jgi:hypothetical protein
MSLKSVNTPLQSGVDFMAIGRAGALEKSPLSKVDTFEFGTTMTAGEVIRFGGACVLDTDGGVRNPDTGDVAANIVGFAVYQNTGIIEDNGYKKGGLIPNVAVNKFGRMILPVKTGETIKVGDTIALFIGAGADFNTIAKLPGGGADATNLTLLNVMKPARNSENGLIYVDFVIAK